MLCFQIGAVKGGFMEGVAHVIWSFGKRTYGEAGDYPAVYAASLEAGTIGVVITYMNGIFFDLNNYLSQANSFVSNFLLKIRYVYLIVLFMAMSVLLFLRSKKITSRATTAGHRINLDDVVFNSGAFIVVHHLQGTLIHPYTHEFPSLADALYLLRLCCASDPPL